MMDYEFNLEEWLPRFPEVERWAHVITGPFHLCNAERLRRGMVDEYDWGEPVPMDVFVMSQGEPPDRHVTKIGGLPYRPADAEWPSTPLDEPYTFLAQFNFEKSKDLVGKLPNEVLVLFGDAFHYFEPPLHWEWWPLGIDNLMTQEQLPASDKFIAPFFLAPCYGNRCRVMSFPNATRRTTTKYPQIAGEPVIPCNALPQFQATQIGRAPFFIQDRPSSPGQPLCTISSIQPDYWKPFPWANRPAPLLTEDHDSVPDGLRKGELMLGDLGCIYIFIEDDGTLHFDGQCY